MNSVSSAFKILQKFFLFKGDSSKKLRQILGNIHNKATFWLDGHYSGGETACGEIRNPILAELEAIAKHPVKNHTILIDDVRLFGTREFDFIDLETIISKLLEINPNYQISYEDGIIPNDILVAKPRFMGYQFRY